MKCAPRSTVRRRGSRRWRGPMTCGICGGHRADGARGAKGDVDTYAAANLDFHDRLVELTGNAKLSPPTAARQRIEPLPPPRRWPNPARFRSPPASSRDLDRIPPASRPPRRALFDHVMASPRAHAPHPQRRAPAAPDDREEVALKGAPSPSTAAPIRRRNGRWCRRVDGCRARIHQPGDRNRPHAVSCPSAARPAPPHRRLRRAVVHEPEQPVDRHRGAPPSVHGICAITSGTGMRCRNDDERPQVFARRARFSQPSPTAGAKVAVVTARTSSARCSGTRCRASVFRRKRRCVTHATNGIDDALGLVGIRLPSVYSAATVRIRVAPASS